MEALTTETSAVIGHTPPVCRTLLHIFKWNKETLLERFYEASSEDQFFKSVNLLKPSQGLRYVQKLSECRICFEQRSLTGLQCGHLFCKYCWSDYLTAKVSG